MQYPETQKTLKFDAHGLIPASCRTTTPARC